MFMTDVNDVKIYNLSAGKSLPNWLTDEKRRKLLKQNVDLRKRIELIQDFEMPDECGTITMSPDNQFIIATGTYKPRVKCFEVNNLSIKFERCFDSEVVATHVLSDDYSKMVFLTCDRNVEFHAAHGRHYRLRIPRFGYDMSYHLPTCDLFLVGASSDIYRLNLERGQFLQPYETNAKRGINVCDVNPEHHLLCVGTQEGIIEAWDPRVKKRCSILDVALGLSNLNTLPGITSIKFKNGLQMGIGTQTGQILIYDIRSNQPLIVKDHYNKMPIKQIAFNSTQSVVYSMDNAILKIWNETNGKQICYIETDTKFNDFCTIPNTGMLFFAQQNSKMLTYYIPSLGAAPRWCSFLDNLTEEIESETIQNIYDDYKFVTKQELETLGLEHLEGSNLLRAYMHGYFIDIRLYNKACSVIEPFSFDKYRKDKIRQQIDATRPNRLQIKTNLPKVNQELALKFMDVNAKPKKNTTNLLTDERFKELFDNPDFEIDKDANEYKLLTPVLNRLDKSKMKKIKEQAAAAAAAAMENDNVDEDGKSTDDDLFSERDGSSSDDDDSDANRTMGKELKRQYKQIRKNDLMQNDKDSIEDGDIERIKIPKMIELPTQDFKIKNIRQKNMRTSLGERLKTETQSSSFGIENYGNRQVTFSTGKVSKDLLQREAQLKRHREERKQHIRPTTSLRLKKYIPK